MRVEHESYKEQQERLSIERAGRFALIEQLGSFIVVTDKELTEKATSLILGLDDEELVKAYTVVVNHLYATHGRINGINEQLEEHFEKAIQEDQNNLEELIRKSEGHKGPAWTLLPLLPIEHSEPIKRVIELIKHLREVKGMILLTDEVQAVTGIKDPAVAEEYARFVNDLASSKEWDERHGPPVNAWQYLPPFGFGKVEGDTSSNIDEK